MFGRTILLALLGSCAIALAEYPDSYSVGYGFVTHGGAGPHGHYLPAVARVKEHKDPFQHHYSLDEEGPTHYKYVRSSTSTNVHHPPPIAHHPHAHGPGGGLGPGGLGHGGLGHHHPGPAGGVFPVSPLGPPGASAAAAVGIGGGVGIANVNVPIPASAGYGPPHSHGQYGAPGHGHFGGPGHGHFGASGHGHFGASGHGQYGAHAYGAPGFAAGSDFYGGYPGFGGGGLGLGGYANAGFGPGPGPL